MSEAARGIVRRFWPWLCAALSGGLLALCYEPFDQAWLCWVALAPLVCAVWFSRCARRAWLKNLALGYVAGLVFFSIVFDWLGSLAELAENRWLLALPVLLAFYMALYFASWAWFIGFVVSPKSDEEPAPNFLSGRRNLAVAFLCASAWTALEWLRGVVFSGFGWNGLGVAMHGQLELIQIADITGVGGISFVIAFTNIIAVITVRRFKQEIGKARIRPHYDFNLTMTLIVLVFSYGVRALQRPVGNTMPLRVAAVQANIPQNEKFDNAFEEKIFARYKNLTEAALALNPQLVIWPEAATPRGMFPDETNYHFVLDLAKQGDSALLLGSLDSDEKGEYNVAVLLTDHGAKMQEYAKIHLVPFGEYVFFRDSFPLFAWIVGDLVPADFRAGKEFTLLTVKQPPVKLAALICFEDTLGDLTRRFVQRGAQVLVNITNDGWFMRSQGAEQHLANAVFRAVETRRPLVRCANTGVTCFVDTRGNVQQALLAANGRPFTEGVLAGKIDVPAADAPLTFYTRNGEWFSLVACAVTALSVAGFATSAFRKK